MNNAYDIYIGVDPDKDKSGIAVYEKGLNKVTIIDRRFPEMIKFINEQHRRAQMEGKRLLVVIEASWLSENVRHHAAWTDNKGIAARKGYAVGYNHAVGILLKEVLDDMQIPNLEQRPLKKTWSGPDRKITHEELAYIFEVNRTEGMPRTTNQEKRDAALLAIYHTKLVICNKNLHIATKSRK